MSQAQASGPLGLSQFRMSQALLPQVLHQDISKR